MDLNTKYTEWKEWLDGNLPDGQIDSNSVAGVIIALIQELAIHESYNEICRINPNSHLATGIFGYSTTFAYFEVQALRIRRLIDKRQDVYSIRRIVDDIKKQKNNGKMTRRNICKIFNYPTTAKQTERLYLKQLETIGSGSFSTHLIDAASLHKTLDLICTKSGILSQAFLNDMESRTHSDKNPNLQNVKDYVDKNIAHASSEASRRQLNRDIRLNTDSLNKAIQTVVETFYLLEMFIKRASYGSLLNPNWAGRINNLNDEEKSAVMNKFKQTNELCEQWKMNAYKILNG